MYVFVCVRAFVIFCFVLFNFNVHIQYDTYDKIQLHHRPPLSVVV